MFINIYSQKHTRVAATEWILQNIPHGSTIALEHWDDGMPLTGGENYQHIELTLYDQPDDEKKWAILNEKLRQADYIIIASNRLYVPLQKLSDCNPEPEQVRFRVIPYRPPWVVWYRDKKYKSCYPKTAEYYRKLFSNSLVIPSERSESRNLFKKVAEFSAYPRLCFMFQVSCFTINDQTADESFTVYDHPKIIIFQKF